MINPNPIKINPNIVHISKKLTSIMVPKLKFKSKNNKKDKLQDHIKSFSKMIS